MSARFVIHAHSGFGPLHFDLMLQHGAALATWQFADNPVESAERELTGERIQDHRTAYLDYEGPVSGGRGRGDRVEAGTFDLIGEQPDRWELALAGRRLRGSFALCRCRGSSDRWCFRRVPGPPPG